MKSRSFVLLSVLTLSVLLASAPADVAEIAATQDTWVYQVDTIRTETSAVFMVPDDIQPGEYEFTIALLHMDSQASQIRLAIAGDDGQKRYRIGRIRIA